MKILVTGSNGQLGSELRRLFAERTTDDCLFIDIGELDITDPVAVHSFFHEHRPEVCINCAAYTAVDKAESEPDLARKVNVTGVEVLAKNCEDSGASLVHISTDFVFNGEADKPYSTDHPVSPVSVYGLTKAEGENRALSTCSRTWLVRTSWVYSAFGGNFVKTMIRLGKERSEINVVNDQVGSPTWAKDLARAILTIIDQREVTKYGIYHFSDKGAITWFDLAAAVMDTYGLNCKVNPIPTSSYPTPAKRPAYSVLDLSGTASVPGMEIPDWKTSLQQCIEEIKTLENA